MRRVDQNRAGSRKGYYLTTRHAILFRSDGHVEQADYILPGRGEDKKVSCAAEPQLLVPEFLSLIDDNRAERFRAKLTPRAQWSGPGAPPL
jgi:hypothetical protein